MRLRTTFGRYWIYQESLSSWIPACCYLQTTLMSIVCVCKWHNVHFRILLFVSGNGYRSNFKIQGNLNVNNDDVLFSFIIKETQFMIGAKPWRGAYEKDPILLQIFIEASTKSWRCCFWHLGIHKWTCFHFFISIHVYIITLYDLIQHPYFSTSS